MALAAMTFDHRIGGIPCVIRVDHFFRQPADHGTWDSDLDYSGYIEAEYTICDRRGRPAPWLERKRTPDDDTEILAEIDNIFS